MEGLGVGGHHMALGRFLLHSSSTQFLRWGFCLSCAPGVCDGPGEDSLGSSGKPRQGLQSHFLPVRSKPGGGGGDLARHSGSSQLLRGNGPEVRTPPVHFPASPNAHKGPGPPLLLRLPPLMVVVPQRGADG